MHEAEWMAAANELVAIKCALEDAQEVATRYNEIVYVYRDLSIVRDSRRDPRLDYKVLEVINP